MKKTFILSVILFLAYSTINAQGGVWIWKKGPGHSTGFVGDTGHYGTIGLPNIANVPPSRYQAAYWRDLKGDFWVFGGNTKWGDINDLWRYNIKTNTWTWMNGPKQGSNNAGNFGVKGVPSATNLPPGRGYGANCWTDNNGDLWLFGGTSGKDDLWRYNIATNEWTWMAGHNAFTAPVYGTKGVEDTANTPGSRQECKSGWVDSLNNLWAFGGTPSGSANDLWRFDIATNKWAWMKGNTASHYGTLGVEDAANMPGARWSYTKWKDGKDNFYIFAGYVSGGINDAWRYNPHTNNWTWLGGDSTSGSSGSYINKCQFGHGNYPASRYENQTAQTLGCSETFWTFGGFATGGMYNDLWLYKTSTNEWNWVSGDKVQDSGHYGTQGVPSSLNMIPSRAGVCTWTDSANNLWVFGGYGYDGSTVEKNDLWVFVPDTSCIPAKFFVSAGNLPKPTDTIHCAWQATYLNVKGIKNIHVTPNDGSFVRLGNGDSALFRPNKTTTYTITYGQGGACAGSGTLTFTIHVHGGNSDFNFSDSSTTLLSPLVHLSNNSGIKNTGTFEWIYNGKVYSTHPDTSVLFITPGTHCFTLVELDTSHYHCNDTVTHCIRVTDTALILVPTAFSPNNDGVNDYFKIIYGDKILIKNFEIFSRWGQMVYSSTTRPWDGTINGQPAETGTYVYFIQAQNIANNRPVFKKGTVELIR